MTSTADAVVYPNPASGTLNISGLTKGESYTYSLIDLIGRQYGSGVLISTIDIAGVPRGECILKITGREESNSVMVIVR